MAGLLVDDTALLEHLGLAADLVLKAVVQALEGVDVLELGLGAQAGGAAAAQAHVAVAAHGAVLQRAVGDAQREEGLAELLHEEACLLGRAQVGLGHELDERGPAAVVVNERLRGAGDAALLAAHVDHLGGVLLHVDAEDADGRGVGAVGALVDDHGRGGLHAAGGYVAGLDVVRALLGALARDLKVKVAVHAEGDGTLRGLEVLGHVGIEVVLAVEHGVLLDLAVGCQARHDDGLDGTAVGHGQRTGHAQADGAHVGVGRVVVGEAAVAEHLGVQSRELGVDLQADDGLPVLQDLLELLHWSSPPFPANAGATAPAASKPRSMARANCRSERSLKAGPWS